MIVETEGLRRTYGSAEVLAGIDLEVAEGTVLALLGPNGAGKTTAVHVLTTLVRPSGGTARVAGFDVVREPRRVREVIGLTGQFAAVDAEQTGRENLVMLARLSGRHRVAARAAAGDLLDRFDLADAADRRVRTYSGGMRRRLDLAMSLVGAPRVLFLDEPTTGLDPAGRAVLWDAVDGLVRDGTTVVLTTQYLEEADRLADRVVLLDRGRVAAAGTADALKARVGGERLELEFPAAADAVRAAARTGAGGAVDGRVLALASDGSAAHLRRVLDDLAAAGLEPLRARSHRPTLDDVFRSLTGRPTTPPAVPAEVLR
jgi:ABC-2 type transport system ATP-binding protein